MGNLSADGCVNCATTRHPIGVGNRCKYCNRLVLRIAEAKRWDAAKPKSLRGFPIPTVGPRTDATVAVAKRIVLRELEKELSARRSREKVLQEPSGLDLEYKLTMIANRCGIKRRMFHGAATGLASKFTGDTRMTMARILQSIIDESDNGFRITRGVVEEIYREIGRLSTGDPGV